MTPKIAESKSPGDLVHIGSEWRIGLYGYTGPDYSTDFHDEIVRCDVLGTVIAITTCKSVEWSCVLFAGRNLIWYPSRWLQRVEEEDA